MKKLVNVSVIIIMIASLLGTGCVNNNTGRATISSSGQAGVSNYRLHTDLDPKTGEATLAASFILTPKETASGMSFLLDPLFDVKQVKVDGIPVNFRRTKQGISLSINDSVEATNYLIEVNYSAKMPDDGDYFYARNGEAFLSHRLNWYPILSGRPLWNEAKLSATVPPGFNVTTQGVLTEVQNKEDGSQTYNFATNNIEIRYDLYVADFVILHSASDDLKIQICILPEDKESSQEHLEMLKKIAEIYTEAFGPLPFGKISYISAREYSFNASGGPLAISNRTSFLNMAERGYYLLAHEVAHNYWGHTVMGNGPDLALLSEAFADYSAYHAIREIYSEKSYSNFLSYAAAKYFQEISKAEKSLSIADILTKFELDSPISTVARYHKGSWLLAMLENYLGRDQFHKAMRAYAEFYGREGIYPDFAGFISIVEQDTGEDLGWFMDGWYKSAGEPEFTLNNLEWNGEGSLLLQLAMDNFTTSLPVEIGIETEKERLSQVHWVNPGENLVSIQLASPPLEVEVDPRMRILKSPNNIEYSGLGSQNKLIFSIP